MPILFMANWSMTRMARKRGWLSTELVIISIWLLNSFSAGQPFDEHNNGEQASSHSVWKTYGHTSYQEVFLTNFPIMLFPNPWQFNQSIGYRPSITHQSIYPSKQNIWTCVAPELLPRAKISLCQCRLGFSYTGVVILQLYIFRWFMYTISKPDPTCFYFSQLIIGHTGLHRVYRCMLGSRWHWNSSGNQRLWSNFFIQLAYTCRAWLVWSCIYHIQLIMDWCCAHPSLWLDGSDNAQLLLASSGLMIIWLPTAKCSVSTKAQ